MRHAYDFFIQPLSDTIYTYFKIIISLITVIYFFNLAELLRNTHLQFHSLKFGSRRKFKTATVVFSCSRFPVMTVPLKNVFIGGCASKFDDYVKRVSGMRNEGTTRQNTRLACLHFIFRDD